jgi:hypothetical protein
MEINTSLEKRIVNIDWQTFHENFSDIFEGQSSLQKDVKKSIDNSFIIKSVLSGLLFAYVCTWGLLEILSYLNLSFETIIIALIIVTVYIFQEVLKDSPLKDLHKNQQEPAIFSDMAEMYTVNNSIKDSVFTKYQSRFLLHITARLIGPLIFINEPNFMVDRLLIYWNEEINKIIYFYLTKDNSKSEHYFEMSNYHLKQPNRYGELETDQIIDIFLKKRTGESIKNFFNKSPIELFPYLLKSRDLNLGMPDERSKTPGTSSTQENPHQQWLAFKVLNKENPPVIVGYLILHSYKGLPIKVKLKTRRNNTQRRITDQVDVFHIIFYGERGFMNFLKTEFQLNSTPYPLDMLIYEPDDV